MKTKIDIKNIWGRIIFSFEKENNTLRNTVEEAVRQGVSLKYADLCEADLGFGKLCYANLVGANLEGAILINANLKGAYLIGTVLRGAYLNGADIGGADLKDADLKDADIYEANLIDVKNFPYIPFACPSEGEFIGWKKIRYYKEKFNGDFLNGEFIVKLLIPKDAKRCSATTEKCRCDKAKVLEITNIETGESVKKITNTNYCTCVYRVGEMVYPDSFDEDRWNECSHGIHFFTVREYAIDY